MHVESFAINITIVRANEGNELLTIFNKLSLYFRIIRVILEWKCFKVVNVLRAMKLKDLQLRRDVSKFFTVVILVLTLNVLVF